ncbi:histidine kinase [Brevundimonas lenta]|uniref:PAS domain S-box-containing protein n=1 Tax=Brevundimonas lenta TaxID=424796 RepID=A0A7W6JEU2_9CAUL|nr:histidine kinase [Brevundimonas lenta]MBB4082846.1 PAS domain S-box-containing protein [Brevundimonas lenta]
MALVADSVSGPRFAKVSDGLLHTLEWSRPEVVGRRMEDVLPLEAHLPLELAFNRIADGADVAEATATVRVARRRARRMRFRLHPTASGAVVIEVAPATDRADSTGSWRRVLFDHLNLISAGTTYIYDRSPSVGLKLSVLLGFSEEGAQTRSRPARGLVHPDDLQRFLGHRRSLASAPDGHTSTVTTRMRHSDGSWRWIEVREQILNRDSHGAVRQILGFASDVTEHHELAQATTRLAAAVMKAEIDERRRIARELHDSMAQHLVVIDLTMSRLQRESATPLPADAVEDIQVALRAAHEEVRTFSYLLHPPDLERLGLAGAIGKFATGFGARTGLDIRLTIEPMPTLAPVSELTLFRIAQEALMNVHRHARATTVDARLVRRGREIELEVIDNGVGGSADHIDKILARGATGVGIPGMKARLEQLGGELVIGALDRGFRLKATLPVSRDSPSEVPAGPGERASPGRPDTRQ